MMINRDISNIIADCAKFPVIAIVGPRQSGKTTLAKKMFPNHKYLSFEDETIRSAALEDPRKFLNFYSNEQGLILDEFQYVPKILSYIQLDSDEKNRTGYFILTGSQNFLMNAAITQSLAGRVVIINLFPFSLSELESAKILSNDIDTFIFNGFYPRLYDKNIKPLQLYPSYLQSYVERDVRQLVNVNDLHTFQKFVGLCAGRIGQLVNFESLGIECGVSGKTVKNWLSILEASYIIFLLQPYHENFNKRIVKTPKLYFYDTGLACSLLRISSPTALAYHSSRPHLFENCIIADFYKQYSNLGQRPPLYFWRDKNGTYEIDCIIDEGTTIIPVEIKSGQTISNDYFRGISFWNKLTNANPTNSYIIYGGTENQPRSQGTVLGWQSITHFIQTIQSKLP